MVAFFVSMGKVFTPVFSVFLCEAIKSKLQLKQIATSEKD